MRTMFTPRSILHSASTHRSHSFLEYQEASSGNMLITRNGVQLCSPSRIFFEHILSSTHYKNEMNLFDASATDYTYKRAGKSSSTDLPQETLGLLAISANSSGWGQSLILVHFLRCLSCKI